MMLHTQLRYLAFIAAAAALVVAGVWLQSIIGREDPALRERMVREAVAKALAATPTAPSLDEVYARIRPSVVQVQTRVVGEERTNEEGTGVVIDESGSVLTSLHVVEKPGRIYVVFPGGSRSEATITATQPENDIALLRALRPPRDLVPAVLADSRGLRVGQEAIVVGNPFGLTSSLTVGVISGLGRSFQIAEDGARLSGLIQVDAAINPGNSGGPLLNRQGDVVGIVSGLVNPTGQSVFIGIGFAVPIEVAAAAAGPPPF